MHFEIPKLPMRGYKDFAKHYLMIVLSILTALGLEAWIEHTHHAHAAATASTQIETEIRQNLADIQTDIDHDRERMESLDRLRDQLKADVESHASTEIVKQHIHELAPDGIYLDWRWPILRREAWDVAVANQSAGWIPAMREPARSCARSARRSRTCLPTVSMRRMSPSGGRRASWPVNSPGWPTCRRMRAGSEDFSQMRSCSCRQALSAPPS